MPSRDRLLPWLLIPLAAFLAILPLALHGVSCGHDLDFHLLSWQEAATQFAHGNLHPRWAFTPAFGAGEPRFVFYPPLSWTLGALLTLLAAHLQPLLPHTTPAAAFTAVPLAFTFLALAGAGFGMLHLARRFLPPASALVVSVLYLANPYTLFTAFERTAFAELLAAAWLPLLLAAILPSAASAPLPILATAIPLALLWLTNAPAAVIGTYTVAAVALLRLLALVRLPQTRPQAVPLALRAAAATALGLALAAFYIVPAVLERPWVQIALAVVSGMRPDDNTLFHHTPDPDHDAVLHTASLIAVLLLLATLLALAVRLALAHRRSSHALSRTPGRRRASRPSPAQTSPTQISPHNPPAQLSPAQLDLAASATSAQLSPTQLDLTASATSAQLSPTRIDFAASAASAPSLSLRQPSAQTLPIIATLTLAIGLLLTPLSLPLWHHIPELAFLQFPWRLLALLAPLTALSIGLALPHSLPRWTPLAATLLCTALVAPAYRAFHQECDPDDTPEARLALFHSPLGDDPTDEYTPAAADNDALQHNNPPFRLLPLSASDDTPPPTSAQPGPAPLTLHLHPPTPSLLVLNLRAYPTWLVFLNHRLDLDRSPRADGLLAIPLPAGDDEIDIRQHTPAPELAADALSLLSLLGISLVRLRPRRNPLSPETHARIRAS